MPAAVPQSSERVIRVLEDELRQIEQAIADHLQEHHELAQVRQRLCTVPGIGAKNSLPLLVLVYRWQTLTAGHGHAKGLTAYVGLDPQPCESGTSVHGHAAISRMGNRAARQQWSMGALGGMRGHNALRTFYQRLVGRGKAKKLALLACARKILHWAWAVFVSGRPFDAERHLAASS